MRMPENLLTRNLSEPVLCALQAVTRERVLEPPAMLFQQHSLASHVFVVLEGALMLERLSRAGRRQVLAFVFPGDFIGFTPGEFLEYGARLLRRSHIAVIPRRSFVELSDRHAELKKNIGQISNNVLARTLDQIFALGQKQAHERVAFLLMQLQQRDPLSHGVQLMLSMSRQDIADYLGLTTETVSRAFHRLRKDGLITAVKPKSLTIADAEALGALAELE
jgi:CRP/FNR family transcriptional regulator